MPNDDDHTPDGKTEGSAKALAFPVSLAADTSAIVGIGASAGGIEALIALFEAMPATTGAVFIVVLHLDPTRKSHLASVLAAHTKMPVLEIEDGMTVAPDHVYVIAPNAYLTIDGDVLRLTEPAQPRSQRHPVDVLFKSMAEQRHERTVAIILSGTGTNGTQGLREIRAAGGLILVQDPLSARFDGMPRSAIAAGLADHVLAAGAMPATLLRYLQHGYITAPGEILAAASAERQEMAQLLSLVRAQAGLDFRNYKQATIMRRIGRRMSLKDVNDLGTYVDLLRTEPDEIQALAKDLLINVTSFFRDAEAWAVLDEMVITQIVADRTTGDPLRVWVSACATGEEAYSIAMLLTERAEAAHKHFDLKIFASDVLADNLTVARAGVFPGSSVEMLAPERVRRFFEKLDGSYQVVKSLRELIVFAKHDILRDPPFSRMDLITCRNMLIYIEPEAQRRAMTLFHFALREDGCLFLGSAETLGRADDLFETLSKKWRIYRRLGATRHDIVDFPSIGSTESTPREDRSVVSDTPLRVTDLAKRALLDRYAPASVLVDAKGRVLYFHGPTSDYLQLPTGEPTRDLLAMARDGLPAKLRGALYEAAVNARDTEFEAELRQGQVLRRVRVTVFRLPPSQQAVGLVVVTFEPKPELYEAITAVAPLAQVDQLVAPSNLEAELRSTRAELQSAIEQLERANEELKASNEEATSMNEELQSTNEELETSKEELQSFNEELHTVNNQLQFKVQELEEARDDLSNLLSGTGIATLFLDTRLLIKWFSPATEQVLDLQSSDIGRPFSHFARKFADDALVGDAEAVLAKLVPIEGEVRGDDDRWFLRRMLPYRTRDNRIAGLVITFTDITERKRSTDRIDEARIYSEAIVATARQAFLVLDANLQVQSANEAFYTMVSTTPDRTGGRHIYDLGVNQEWNTVGLRTLLEAVLPRDEQFQDVELEFGGKDGDSRSMVLNGRRLLRGDGRESLILLAIEENTERKRAEAALIQSEKEFRTLGEEQPNLCWMAAADGGVYWYNKRWYDYTGTQFDEMKGWGWQAVHDPALLPDVMKSWTAAVAAGTPLELTFPLRGADGIFHPFLTRILPIRDETGAITRWLGSNVNISEQRATEDALRTSEEALRLLNETLGARVAEAIAAREQAQERLAQAQRMEALGQLAGGIAHDFNNVLQVVSSALDLIERRADDGNSVRNIARVGSDAARRGTSVTARLLAFARKGELQAASVAVGPLLESLKEILSSTLEAGIRLELRVPPDIVPLMADKAQLETVLVNLAVNARDAMPGGGVLSLSATPCVVTGTEHRAGLKPGRYVQLEVKDNGIGMDAATLARVSEPFFTTKPIGHGTGLGVAMSRGFAEQSGGGFAVQSEPGRGTTITLWFPEAREPSASDTVPQTAIPGGISAKVMIVDDDDSVREMIRWQLDDLGYETAVASDGLIALARMDAGEALDVLVTDLSMPGMNGLALIEEARKRHPGLPALLLTGYADTSSSIDINGLGDGTRFLQKPISVQQLAENVATLLVKES